MAESTTEPSTDLVLVGCGLRAADHLTREGEREVRAARVIFHSTYSRDFVTLLRELNPAAEFIAQEDGEYLVGQYRPDMYRRIADRALDEAARGPGVVVLHPGSVSVVDAIARRLVSEGAERGLRVRVVPGISSVEFVLSQMGWDLADGLQVILAQSLVLHRRRLDPEQAGIVIQPGYFDTRWFAGAPLSRHGRFDALHSALSATHPPTARMALVLAPVGDGDEARVVWFRLERLPQLAAVITPFHTLFVPPLRASPADAAFAARIDDWATLLSHVELDQWQLPRQCDPRRWFDVPGAGIDSGVLEESRRLALDWPAFRASLRMQERPS